MRRRGWQMGQTLVSMAEDVLFERWHGIEVRQRIAAEAMAGVVGESGSRGRAYHPTRARHLRVLLRALALPPGLGFLDVGSGKGLALLVATEPPSAFARIVGVEHSSAIAAIAARNVARYRARTGRGHNITLQVQDAATLAVDEDLHVFYLFNPFDEVVLTAVLGQIAASLRRAPRAAWIITNKVGPVDLDALLGPEFGMRLVRELSYGNAAFRVYACPAAPPSLSAGAPATPPRGR